MDPMDGSLYFGIGEAHAFEGKFKEALESMLKVQEVAQDHDQAKTWISYLKTKMGEVHDGISQLQSLSPSPLSMYLLGKSMWEADGHYRKDKSNCFTALVKAAKLDAYRGDTFFLLGNFYAQVQRDSTRAMGCYRKAYALDQQHHEAAACLADAYVEEGQTELAIKLYENITKELGSAGGKWAWLRLGLYKLKAKDMSSAIQCFQVALRIDNSDRNVVVILLAATCLSSGFYCLSICWECLGEGYLQRGSYTAAWKAFDRARQLSPRSVYCLYQIARVKQVQGIYPDAIKEFHSVLELFPDYVPAMKGLGESELSLARQMFYQGRYQSGVEHIENAIETLVHACSLRRDLCCLWKLLGDACISVHCLNDTAAKLYVPSIILGEAPGKKTVQKSQLLSLSTKFYIRAIELHPDDGFLWHDLGIAFFRLAENESNEESASALSRKSMNALKKAITYNGKNHTFWCSLGVVTASKFVKDSAIAQHCFLMSIRCEQNNVQAWSNLATLYLENDYVKQAHEAFKVAQSLEPSFTNSWVGQAIVAEAIASEETMDLYRHSTELGLQQQGISGYSSWVVKVMKDKSNRQSAIFKENITDMNAVSMATTQISKACLRNPVCPWSATLYGFLLEYSGLNQSAEKAYESAYRHLRDIAAESKDIKENKDIAAFNLARLFCKNGKYDEAISLYNRYSQTLGFPDACGLALSYFYLGEYENSVKSYQLAGTKTTMESQKAEVMVAMAMVYWKMGKKDEAKTVLYQCFQNSKPGLRALLSLGVSVKDSVLIGAAVGEIMKNIAKSNDEYETFDDCLLISAAAKVHGDSKVAVIEVQKAIRRFPSSAVLRGLLCRLLIHLNVGEGVLSTPNICNTASKLHMQKWTSTPLHKNGDLWKASWKHEEDCGLAMTRAMSSLVAGSHKTCDDVTKHTYERLRQAQIFAHLHPYESSSWSILNNACHAKNVSNSLCGIPIRYAESAAKLSNISTHFSVTKPLKIWSEEMRCWSDTFTVEESSVSDQDDPNLKFIKLIQSAASAKEKGKLQHILKDITGIMGATQHPAQASKYFGELLVYLRMFQVARKMFHKSLALCESKSFGNTAMYLRILQLLYNLWGTDDAKEMAEGAKDILVELVKLIPKSPICLLLQGLISRSEGNHRKAKSYFNRIAVSTELFSDSTRNVAIWYLYRTLHERNDWTEIEKLAERTMQDCNDTIGKIMELLPPVS